VSNPWQKAKSQVKSKSISIDLKGSDLSIKGKEDEYINQNHKQTFEDTKIKNKKD